MIINIIQTCEMIYFERHTTFFSIILVKPKDEFVTMAYYNLINLTNLFNGNKSFFHL